MTKAKTTPPPASVIRFVAIINQIRTTIDGGANVTFSLSGNEVTALTQLLQVRQQTGVVLEVAAVPVLQKEKLTKVDDETEKKAKRSSPHVDRGRFAN
jgi:hypothetical protein